MDCNINYFKEVESDYSIDIILRLLENSIGWDEVVGFILMID